MAGVNSLRLTWALGLATLLASGCGSGSDLRGVRGDLTYDGEPIATGTIEFTPIDGTKGPLAGAGIQDSRYEVPQHHGVLAGGTYKVSIVSMRKTGRKVPDFTDKDGKPLDEFANYVPAQFNSATTLQVRISDDNPNRVDFHLNSVGKQSVGDSAEAHHETP